MKKKTSFPAVLLWMVFAFYVMILVDVLFVTRAGLFINPFQQEMTIGELMNGSINLRPFHTISGYLRVIKREGVRNIQSYAVQNLFGNLILFFPMGCFLPVMFRVLRTFPRTMIVTGIMIVCVEMAQLATRTGSCDVDDLILNLAGCAAGYLFYRILSVIIPPLRKR